MERIPLGATSLSVSRLCLGVENADLAHITPLLREATAQGSNWWDIFGGTHVSALREVALSQNRQSLVLSAHCSARSYQQVMDSLLHHLANVQSDYLDILFLNDVRSLDDLTAREDAIAALQEAKSRGAIRATGIYTHDPQVMCEVGSARHVDVLMASMENEGLASNDWLPQVDAALHAVYQAGCGIVLTDILRGRLAQTNPAHALNWAISHPDVHAVRFAAATTAELRAVTRLLETRTVEEQSLQFLWRKAA